VRAATQRNYGFPKKVIARGAWNRSKKFLAPKGHRGALATLQPGDLVLLQADTIDKPSISPPLPGR